MSWEIIKESEAICWNERLKSTNAPYSQYPYFSQSVYQSFFSKTLLIKYVHQGKIIAFAAVIEFGFPYFRVGVIERGPVLFEEDANVPTLLEDLKELARKRRYLHLQLRPNDELVNQYLNNDHTFRQAVLFPFYRKEDYDLNIYRQPEEQLLAHFKGQCRRKIVLAGRVPFTFKKLNREDELDRVIDLLQKVEESRGYLSMAPGVLEKLYRAGRKHGLCDIYIASLHDKPVNAVFIVKDAASYFHFTSGLVVDGYKDNESPPAKLHYFLMEECFYVENKEYYNISYGGSNNLMRFKELFNPVPVERFPYYTFVIRKTAVKFFQGISPQRVGVLRDLWLKIKRAGIFYLPFQKHEYHKNYS